MALKRITLPTVYTTLIRLVSFFLFLISSFQINQYSIGCLIILLISFYLIEKRDNIHLSLKELDSKKLENPYLKFKNSSYSQLKNDELNKIKDQLFNQYAIDYSFSDSLKFFEELKNKSDCLFAKKSKLWGAPSWNKSLSIKENVHLLIFQSFLIFTNVCESLNLDGYLIQLPGQEFGHDLEKFARVFCELLTALSDMDPAEKKCMNKEIESSKWVFEFNKITFFITTFLPLYGETNSRYSFDINECFILFQPEISFAHHNLPYDTPITHWKEPKTVRDKIRINFRNSNRAYKIRETVSYPMCYDIIKPIDNNSSVVNWWKYAPYYVKLSDQF